MPTLVIPAPSCVSQVAPINATNNNDLELWKKYKAGNQSAKWELLKNFRGIISKHARQMSNVRPYSVVEAELKELTLKAFDTYDPGRGVKLSTHVMSQYKKVSRENISNQHAIRIPENVHFRFKPIAEANAHLTDTLGREPTNQEISDYTGWDLPRVVDAQSRLRKELVESKQTYDPGVNTIDPTAQAFHYTHSILDDQGKYILEHTTGYNGKQELPDSRIRANLKLSPYVYNKKKNEVISIMQSALHTAESEF